GACQPFRKSREESMPAVASARSATPQVTQSLARRAAGLRAGGLPEAVRILARQCLLDWLAVTLAGAREELSDILLAEAEEQGGRGAATLIGHRLRSPRRAAPAARR